jgi:hypothetical protein
MTGCATVRDSTRARGTDGRSEAPRAGDRTAAAGATFKDVRPRFSGHGACSSDPWINGIASPNFESFHPRAIGYRSGYLAALLEITG